MGKCFKLFFLRITMLQFVRLLCNHSEIVQILNCLNHVLLKEVLKKKKEISMIRLSSLNYLVTHVYVYRLVFCFFGISIPTSITHISGYKWSGSKIINSNNFKKVWILVFTKFWFTNTQLGKIKEQKIWKKSRNHW